MYICLKCTQFLKINAGNSLSEWDPSSPTLLWPRRPALELTEQKRRETRVVTCRVSERGGLQKVGA